MANNSLDSHLFKGTNFLTWDVRFTIVQDLASTLCYLHEEEDQCLLGLARLVDHEKGSQTTHLAETMCYMALEYVSSTKASKESDVYSFRVMRLEIACNRRSIEAKFEDSEALLVAWV
ncbi:hypothetical protein PTKIN_Ptkin02bG0159700 [Pterospermum kingtungense]